MSAGTATEDEMKGISGNPAVQEHEPTAVPETSAETAGPRSQSVPSGQAEDAVADGAAPEGDAALDSNDDETSGTAPALALAPAVNARKVEALKASIDKKKFRVDAKTIAEKLLGDIS